MMYIGIGAGIIVVIFIILGVLFVVKRRKNQAGIERTKGEK